MQPPDSEFPRPEDADLADALQRPIPVPAQVLERLHADREAAMQAARAPSGADNIIPFVAAPARRAGFRPWLAVAAAIAVAAVATWQMWFRGPAPIATLSPQGEVGTTQPEIAWENAADTSYNVWILPGEGDYTTAPALFVAKGVRSPLKFSDLQPGKTAPSGTAELQPDKDYRVLICYANAGTDPVSERIAGTPVKFRITARQRP